MCIRDSQWIATNTDVDGFIYPLKSIEFPIKHAIVLGSGGAARSVIQGLIDLYFSKITIISRNEKSLNKFFPQVKTGVWPVAIYPPDIKENIKRQFLI